ncbi:odorant receptor 13a-like [Schistocerca piceifrons]|uniref:odorant receptor 13a-like n=1 Tax=Schistocerca piceifrons TaxID=274613 RepID=UPI001F5FE02D|nr:odorant receptor 13a-like [Schistocerca piceifrons]
MRQAFMATLSMSPQKWRAAMPWAATSAASSATTQPVYAWYTCRRAGHPPGAHALTARSTASCRRSSTRSGGVTASAHIHAYTFPLTRRRHDLGVSAILHFWGDIISITNSVCVTFVYILAIFKLVILLKMRRLTDELVENLDRCMERYGSTFEREKAFVFGECARRGRWISLMQAWMGLCLYVAWEVQPMLRVQSCSTTECRSQSGFPTVVWYPFSFTEPPAYQVVFIVVSTGLFYGNIISITVHSTFCTLMIYVAGHLRILNLMARNLCSTQQYDKATGDHKQRNRCDAEERMRENLRECVRYHIDIERMVQQLSKLVGPILLGELLADMITVSASAFITTALKANSGLLMKYGWYVFVVAEQMFLVCWCGDEVLAESELLQVSVYSCDWTGGSPRFLRELRIVLSRTGRPLMLTASKFYTITRETFLLVSVIE